MNQKNVILINNSVKDCHFIENSTNSDTFPIMYSATTTKKKIVDTLKSKFTSIERIGILFVYNPSNVFLDNKPFFDNENVDFIIGILKEFNVKNIDYLSCDTLNDVKWTNYYSLISNENVIVGASETKLGNGGNWILENTNENIEVIYFTPQIEKYEHVLDNPYGSWVSGLIYGPKGIAINGNDMYVTNYGGSISKINISDGTITELEWITGLTNPQGIAIYNNYLYVANNGTTISKINMFDKSTELNWISGLSEPTGLVINGNDMYVTNNGEGTISKINIFDGTITELEWISGLNTSGVIAINGNDMYVTINGGTISKINISDGTITELVWISGLTDPQGIAIYNNYLYATNYSNGTISKINIFDKSTELNWGSGLPIPYGISINNNNIYVVCNFTASISKININIQYTNSSFLYGIRFPQGIAINGNDMYVTNNEKISKINISSGTITEWISGLNTSGGIAINGNDMYVTNYDGTISKINISDGTITELAWISGLNIPVWITINGNDMYVTNYSNGTISKINISDGTITELVWISGLIYQKGLAIHGNYLYVTNDIGTISKINIFNKSTESEWISGLDNPYGLAINGNDMYVTNTITGTISKINISNGTITEIEWASGLYNSQGIAIIGNYLYVTNYSNGTIDKFSLPIPISDICFPKGTPIVTNQGIIPIDKLTSKNTIDHKKIVGITKTISQDNYLVCFKPNSLSINMPSKETIMTKDHKIYYKSNFIKANDFVNTYYGVTTVKYTGEPLYNVLMEDYYKMNVNNLICETLNPTSEIAKLYNYIKLHPSYISTIIEKYNKNAIKHNKKYKLFFKK